MKIKRKIWIPAIIAVVAIAAVGSLYVGLKGADSQSRPRRFSRPLDPNLPNPDKMTGKQISEYIDSTAFRNLPVAERMNYFRHSGRKVMEYQTNTYFTLPAEQKTAYLDNLIDRMQDMRANMEKYRASRQAAAGGQRRAPDPSRMRARSERGTPEERAKRQQFFTDLRKRAEERGIQMRGPGGGFRGGTR